MFFFLKVSQFKVLENNVFCDHLPVIFSLLHCYM